VSVRIQASDSSAASISTDAEIADANLSAQALNFSGYANLALANIGLARFADADSAASASNFTATIDWGDGSDLDVGSVVAVNGTFQVKSNHTYAAPGNYAVTVYVEDQGGSHTTVTATATIAQAQPPMLMPLSDMTTDEGQTLSTTASAHDPQGLALAFSLVNPPAGASIDPTSGQITYHALDAPRTATITVQVTNAAGLSDSKSFNVTVYDVPPIADAFTASESTIYVGDSVTFTLVNPHDPARGDDPSTFTYVWTIDNGTPITNSSPTFTTSFTTSGSHTITVRILDDGGAYTEYTLTVNVMPTQPPPP
jgi:hypothetical protein